MQTTLNLLTRDGAVYMAFSPSLKAAQYAELLEVSELSKNSDELCLQIAAWARENGIRYSFDPAQDPAGMFRPAAVQ